MKLILGSASPRRLQLMQQLGHEPIVVAPDIDERPLPHEQPVAYVLRMAIEKSRALQPRFSDEAIVTADTIVCLNDVIFGKPQDAQEAFSMLRALSGVTHQVHTGVCVFAARERHCVHTSAVAFKNLSDAEILDYIESGEPFGKAGAYAIQGRAGAWVRHLSGSFSSVMGLPLYETAELLQASR